MKRISFDESDACHIYEWLCMYWVGSKKFGGCYTCQKLGKRLERLIGPVEVRRIKRIVKEKRGSW